MVSNITWSDQGGEEASGLRHLEARQVQGRGQRRGEGEAEGVGAREGEGVGAREREGETKTGILTSKPIDIKGMYKHVSEFLQLKLFRDKLPS